MSMQRNVQYVLIVFEALLNAIAMMHIPVDDRYATAMYCQVKSIASAFYRARFLFCRCRTAMATLLKKQKPSAC